MLRKLRNFAAVAVLAVTPMATLLVPAVAHAAVDTCTWTGTVDSTFSNGGNWTGCDNSNVPEAGDTLEFTDSLTSSWTLVNDLGFAFAGVNLVADGTGTGTGYNIDTLTFATGATINQSQANNGNDNVYTSTDIITAQGALTLDGLGEAFNFTNATTITLNGVLTLTGGVNFYAEDVGSSGVVVENDSLLFFTPTSANPATPSFPITLGGGTGTSPAKLGFYAYNPGGGYIATSWAFANPIILAGDARIFLGQAEVTVNQTGTINGPGFALSLDANSATGSTLVLGASTNNSNTVLGTFTGGGAGAQAGADAPAAPDTGFALVSAHPGVTLAITLAATAAILAIARMPRTSSVRVKTK